MNKIFLFFLLPLSLAAQTNQTDSIIKANPKISFRQITTSIPEASDYYSCENLRGNAICFENLEAALALDVFKYYGLEDTYSTPLKKSNYVETQDYKDKLNNLKSIKADYTNKSLYIELDKTEEFKVYDYDLTKGGFYIRLGFMTENEVYFYNKYYELRQLPIKLYLSDFYSPTIHLKKLYDRIFFLPIAKDKAVKIEDTSPENLKMLVIFKPTSLKRIKLDFPQDYQNFATTDNIRLLIMNSVTSEIYYDQNFAAPKEPKKK